MTTMDVNSLRVSSKGFVQRPGERGAALAIAMLMLTLLSAIAVTVLAVVHTETRIAGGDLKRTQTFYAAAAGIEKMTSDYSALFGRTSRPTQTQFDTIAGAFPAELIGEGFQFNSPATGACNCSQSITSDTAALFEMRTTQGIDTASTTLPRVTMPPNSPFGGLIASVDPYVLKSTATFRDGTQVQLTRNMNNYLIPLFQFGMFSDEDIELHPGAPFTFNGRVHANGNIYANGVGPVRFLDKVTTANEFIYDVLRNGGARNTSSSVTMVVGTTNVAVTQGSMTNGPKITGATAGQRGFFPLSFTGTPNTSWDTTSVQTADGTANKFGGQLLTRTTGASPLKLPMQLDGAPTREIIKRRMPNDNLAPPAAPSALSESRYHSKAGIRILIDDEGVTNDAAGLYAAQNGTAAQTTGVNLSGVTIGTVPGFIPSVLPAGAGGGQALWRFTAPLTTAANAVQQQTAGAATYGWANTVRGTQALPIASAARAAPNTNTGTIPAGAGLSGHIVIQIVAADGTIRDVTQTILSMGVTEGEPNSIVQLQRPLWAAFTQGSRDASGGVNQNLTDIVNNTYLAADGEIQTSVGPAQNALGYLTSIVDDTAAADLSGAHPIRVDAPPSLTIADWGLPAWSTSRRWNTIVPINVYNVREGRVSTAAGSDSVTAGDIYERGITNVVQINMTNLARWMDGFYDANLLAGTPAVSANINRPDGYVVYVSDRRGDNVKAMVDLSGATINSTNGMVDNVDVYGPNDQMDAGEDVQGTGAAVGSALVKDTNELEDPSVRCATTPAFDADVNKRALQVASWTNSCNYFRRSVRLSNAADLQTTAAAVLSTTLGVSVASENMVYTWGNYNTTGINVAPPAGTSSLNDSTQTSYYLPIAPGDRQVPASIVCDAFFPLSKTWFDSSSAMYPATFTSRVADLNLPAVTDETSVRAGIIAGNNLGALANAPDAGNGLPDTESRLNGGMHNFPRFLENWGGKRFNFVGSLIPLYRSTQALGPYNASSTIYSPPTRNWAFDVTFTNPARLPPGTPQFQHIEPTGFRQVL